MKIGIIRRGYSATGGAERYLLRFAAGVEKAGHEVVLFSDRQWPDAVWAIHGRETIVVGGEEEVEPEERAEPTPKPDDALGGLGWHMKEWVSRAIRKGEALYLRQKRKRKMSPMKFATELRDVVRPREHCECLFSLERVWDCDCFRAGDGVHAAWLERRAKHEPAWKRWAHKWSSKHRQIVEIERALYAREDGPHIIANSSMVAEEIRRFYGTKKSRITVVPNGYDVPLITAMERERVRAEERERLGLGEYEAAFLFVGSGWARKGLRFAAYAARRITALDGDKYPVRLLVAGSDRHASRLSSRQSPDPVTFLGPQDAQSLARLYLAADVFVLPTIYDPFSNATLEAAAFGLPIITTNSNGFSEHMPPFKGAVIEDPCGGLLLTAFREWRDPNRRSGVWENNTEVAMTFSVDRNIEDSIAVFLKLVKKRSSAKLKA